MLIRQVQYLLSSQLTFISEGSSPIRRLGMQLVAYSSAPTVVDYHRFKIVFGCLCKDYKMYGGSFLYHVGGYGQSLVSLGLVVSHFLSFLTTTIPVYGLSSRTVWVKRV